jgi:hypothetical protein
MTAAIVAEFILTPEFIHFAYVGDVADEGGIAHFRPLPLFLLGATVGPPLLPRALKVPRAKEGKQKRRRATPATLKRQLPE